MCVKNVQKVGKRGCENKLFPVENLYRKAKKWLSRDLLSLTGKNKNTAVRTYEMTG